MVGLVERLSNWLAMLTEEEVAWAWRGNFVSRDVGVDAIGWRVPDGPWSGWCGRTSS